ncbi:c-type cytochrome [Aurantimonas marina]|uniref:c-type cytochrome n=1 Tax=Aurantimonas marina TaxID=2780508 RepID=UPI0019D0CBBE|nr:cytochrome c [Aurantimonas marina]
MSPVTLAAAAVAVTVALAPVGAMAAPGHSSETENDGHGASAPLEEMREMHQGHEHGHDFEAIEEMPPEQVDRMMGFMRDIGIAMPPLDAERGRQLFVDKGCVVCHSVNGVGVEVGPSLDAAEMPSPMNAFEFAARMWRGAPAMAAMQEAELGAVIDLSGQDLADLVAFAHDVKEQKKLTLDQVPEKFRDKLAQ